MASLKEVKTRIDSVGSTKKITVARQMVSSARLHQTQALLENVISYKNSFDKMLAGLLCGYQSDSCPFMQEQTAGPVAVVIMSSNSGMCGSFNTNMTKILNEIRSFYPEDELLFFPVGKKIREAVERTGYKTGFENGENIDHLVDGAPYGETVKLASYLISLYLDNKVKQVDMIYYKYKNRAIQEIKETTLLPYSTSWVPKSEESDIYIFEPSRKEIVNYTIPMAVKINLYYALIENQTSEHAARTMAMQLATENADEILDELQLTYNKLRQQNITSELLDIIGSSFA